MDGRKHDRSENRYVFLDNICYTLKRGDVAIFNPFDIHYAQSREADYYERYVLNFKEDLLMKILSREETGILLEKFPSCVLHLPEREIGQLYYEFQKAEQYEKKTGSLSEKMMGTQVLQIIMLLIEHMDDTFLVKGKKISPQMIKVLEYIQAHYVEDYRACGENAIQTAIDACAKAGGGTVVVSEGTWETKPIHLKSRIHLRIEKGADVIFSRRFDDYLPVVFTRWEGVECYNYSSLIYARDCTDIAVTGAGTLWGNGQAWWGWKKLQQKAAEELCYAQSRGVPVEERRYGTEEAALRPSFIQTIGCKNVRIETKGSNTDGINPDSCKNVLIEGCYLDTGDDRIAINSGMNEDGWRVNRPCENVEIRNCEMAGCKNQISFHCFER